MFFGDFMAKNTNANILGVTSSGTAGERASSLKRYQLSWNPSFYSNDFSSVYIIGEDKNYAINGRDVTTDFNYTPSAQDLIDLGVTRGLVLPFNTNIALAQEYAPSIKNKVVTYETMGGNSITTFGEAIRVIGLRIRIIKLSKMWEVYYKGLEALSYLSANQASYYGGLYLTGYDSFDSENSAISYKYKVTVSSLDFGFKSDTNTTVTADLKLLVNNDLTRSRRKWGQL